VARAAIREMQRQVGPLALDDEGIAQRGVLLRHLVMPEAGDDTREIMRWIAEVLGPDTYVNMMAQYWPSGQAGAFPEIARGIARCEFSDAMEAARAAGLSRFDPRT
jgi:putative pyruvate formate lyase activating enzyme